jgi:hypothetical protein
MPAKYWATWASVSTPNLIAYPDGICKCYLFTQAKALADKFGDAEAIGEDDYLKHADSVITIKGRGTV